MLNRILYSNNGVITDYSRELTKYATGTATIAGFIAAEDYFYLGARVPFNHFYFKLTTPNLVPTTLTLQYWDGRTWIDMYEAVDETKGFTQSGFIYFVPKKDNGWYRESTKDKGEEITGLTGINIYDLFWMRIKSSADLTPSIVISWVGQKFSDDTDLGDEFPDLLDTDMLSAFGAGKTSWEAQHVKAAELLTQDLIKAEIINHKEQILVKEEFCLASVQKVAELIYNGMGDDYLDQKVSAQAEYKSRLNKSIYRVDTNESAILDIKEDAARSGFLSR